MKSIYQKGKEAFDSDYCCAESVLKVISEEQKIESELIPGIATGLCSGMAKTCNMCGAVSGGILSLSLYHNKNSKNSKEELYLDINKLVNTFETKFGSSNCKTLLDCDLGLEDGQAKFKENNLQLKCSEYVGMSAKYVSEIINKKK